MNRAYQGVPRKAYAITQERDTAESKYWKKFITTGETKLDSSPNYVSFCENLPEFYLVTGGNGVHLFDSRTDTVQRSFNRFDDNAYCGKLRRDGKVFVAGEKSGHLKVFQVESKFMLRDLRGHTGAVHSTTWASNGLTIISGSDDSTVRRWDLDTGASIWRSKDSSADVHRDYVRFVDSHPNDPNVFVSGSYDHSVKLWDARQAGPISSIRHEHPVEVCKFNPSGTFVVTAAKSEVNVWDMFAGTSHIHTFRCHQKNISALHMNESGTNLFSAGLDGHVKVYNMQKMSLTHGMQFYSPISCFGFAKYPDQEKLIVGFVNGSVVARTYRAKKKKSEAVIQPSLQRGTRLREIGESVENLEDAVLVAEKTKHLKVYEKLLKKFSYQKALDSALKTRNPLTIVTVLEELGNRNGIAIALAGRNENSLEPLLSFAAKYISNPRYSKLTMQVIHHVLDLYGNILGHSDSIDELFVKLRRQIKKEVEFQQQACSILGALDVVLANSSA